MNIALKTNKAAQSQQVDLFSAGMLATVDGGHGIQFGIPIETLSSPDNVTEWVVKRIPEGSDFIKLVYMPDSNHFKSLDRETAVAIIHAAHQKGLMSRLNEPLMIYSKTALAV